MRLASFNVQNMRLRRGPSGPRLDGARDRDLPEDIGPAAEQLDSYDRALTAQLLAEANAEGKRSRAVSEPFRRNDTAASDKKTGRSEEAVPPERAAANSTSEKRVNVDDSMKNRSSRKMTSIRDVIDSLRLRRMLRMGGDTVQVRDCTIT